MGQQYNQLNDKLIQFIAQQHVFFVATAASDGRVNLSPKGMDTLRVIDKNRLAWLNVTGSGNETAAHVKENPRMTIMFMSLSGDPMILRLYGEAKAIHLTDREWNELHSLFPNLPGARQIFDVQIDLVQTSCGMAVPFFEYKRDRNQLNEWAEKKGPVGLREYWKNKNQISLDGKITDIVAKNGVG